MRVKEPLPKYDVIQEFMQLANQLDRRVNNSYRIEQRGSLFSPLLMHVSDADIQLYARSKGKKSVTAAEQACLVNFAKEVCLDGKIQTARWHKDDGSTEVGICTAQSTFFKTYRLNFCSCASYPCLLCRKFPSLN